MTQTNPYQSVHIGPALKTARERAGITQDELARRLGLDESVPSRWECVGSTRYTAVPGYRLPQLAQIFGMSVHDLAPHAEPFAPVAQWDDREDLEPRMLAEAANGASNGVSFEMAHPEVRYTVGDVLSKPSPVPGRPSTEWKVRCWKCRKVCTIDGGYADHSAQCSGCTAPLRADVRVVAWTS